MVPPRPTNASEAGSNGQQVYQDKCAHCHGASGEGTAEYEPRLQGGLSVAQLNELIAETMPADDPGTLEEDESRAVAAYVHATFYSIIARERNRPARIELARLTVRQYRRTVSDLIGSFRGSATWETQRGLKAQYYHGRVPGNRRELATSRIDSQVDFSFGTEVPVPEISDAHRFSMRWDAALLAPETGYYEFVVRTENAARFWLNDVTNPLIDAWVKSGDDTEYRGRLFLTGGSVYPLRLEFSKAKQGVDDSDKQKQPPPEASASISLLWRHPTGTLETIPNRNLSPETAPEVFVCTTPFPPDDRSYGWERGTSVSKAWDQATTSAAIEAARYVVERLNELAAARDEDPDRLEKLRSFCRTFAERAFRHPLDKDERELFVDRQFAAVADPDTAVKRVVLIVLKSPRFLFREVDGGNDQYDVAARLSFGLWDSIPDSQLWQAAAEDRLATRQQVTEHAERMLSDVRARAKLHHFLLTWLKSDSGKDLSKDPEQFPGFDAAAVADLRTSLRLFLDDVVWSDDSDFRRLLLTDEVFLNDRLAKFYGVRTPLRRDVRQGPTRRRQASRNPDAPVSDGQLCSPPTKLAHPPRRVPARGVLGVFLRPPPEAVAPLAPDLHPGLTTRERVALQTEPANCMTCHGIINPLGFTLEHFDAVGRYRELDRGQPIDDTGGYRTRTGRPVTIEGARELAQFLADSEETHTAFAEQLFHHLVQQPVRAYGPTTLDDLRQSFTEHDFNIRELAIEVMATSALVGRETRLTSESATTN